jgi:hypothetical protein
MHTSNLLNKQVGGKLGISEITVKATRQEVTPTLVEWRRAVQPGGVLLLAVHLDEDALHLDEWWGHRVSVDFAFFRPRSW